MIPLRDTTPTRNVPVVNNAIIGINVVIFILQLSQGVEWNKFVFTYGLVPARYSIPQISAYFSAPQQVFSQTTFQSIRSSGIKACSKLRLKGLGKEVESNDRPERGNLYLKVRIQ
jgi:hypothetical protein